MKIKIIEKNAAAIEAALASVNGKATSFATTSFDEVANVVKDAEKRLAMLPAKLRAGAIAVHVPAGPTARAYKYGAQSTRVSLIRSPSSWYLVNIERVQIQPKSGRKLAVGITARQRDEIQRRAAAEFVLISN
jgi:hypothetical protein